MHAAAVPDADATTLKRPEESAREMAEAIAAALPKRDAEQAGSEAAREFVGAAAPGPGGATL
ncbi:MAG TPA: hypothetical protein VF508_03505, partial [Pyrinomonadaceae bacterium]